MKNLCLYYSASTAAVKTENVEGSSVQMDHAIGFCVDSFNNLSYFAFENEIICLNQQMSVERRFDWCTSEFGELVLFEFLTDYMEICAIFSNGAIIIVPSMGDEIQEYPVLFDQKVLGASWSPDLGLLIVATEEKIYSITRGFDIENEVELYLQEPGKEQLMTIGWGARETQFQGAAGKQKREKLDEDTVPGPISSQDDAKVLISWRADAQYFTVSTVEERPNPWHKEDPTKPEAIKGRHLRVWNRDLELMSQCEALAGMEKSLSMRPVGNLMAVTRILNGRRDLWLYERNGQWRSHFEVGSDEYTVQSVGWNTDATILLIHLRKDDIDYIQLWAVSNYDWTLKTEIQKKALLSAKWDSESPKKLHLLTTDGCYDLVEVEAVYNAHDAMVVSVAGSHARITDLSKAPIPPPMFHEKLKFGDSNILLFSQSCHGLAFLLSDLTLVCFKLQNRKYVLLSSVKITPSSPVIPYNLHFVDESSVSMIFNNTVVTFNVHTGEEKQIYQSSEELIYQEYVPSINVWLFQTVKGEWFKFQNNIASPFLKFESSKVYKNEIIEFNGQLMVFSINHNNQLIIDGNIAHQAIGSWSFGTHNFLATSLNNYLYAMTYERLVTLLQSPPKMTAKNATHGWFDERAARNVERGALVVSHESEGFRVFLQMPRGNLETIEPRFCLIPRMKQMIAAKKYKETMTLMRRQRVDMNLIVDHDPKEFFANVKLFVDMVDSEELLNLFIFNLNNEDTTRTSFAAYYPERDGTKRELTEKLSKVCEAVLQVILDIPDVARRHRLYTAALSCFLKQEPRVVRDAFLNMKMQVEASGQPLQQTNEQFIQQKPSLFRKWIKHIKYSVKDGEMFQAALQTYDLTLAYEVADEINMDPREFLPLLEIFQSKSPEAYRRYHIDLHVDDYVSALKNIAQVEEKIDECLAHIKQYKLYSQALLVFHKSPNYPKVCQLCGEQAFVQKQYDEAAILFIKAGDYQNAAKAYELALNVDGYKAVAHKLGHDPAAINRSLLVFALKLEQESRFTQAADIYKSIDGQSNLSKIIENYVKAQEWKKAWIEVENCLDSSVTETIAANLAGEAKARVKTLIEDLSQISQKIEMYSSRLEVVRNEKHKQVEEWLENEGEVDVAQSETMSESSTTSGMSNISRLSKMSTAQAKRRKNVEKKKKTIKEGSQFEDIGLLTALTEIMAKLNDLQKELASLLPVLVAFDFLEDAQTLQKKAVKVVKYASDRRVTVWPRWIKPKHLTGPLVEIYRCEDGIVRMPEQCHMPTRVYIEDQYFPPKLDTTFSWKIKSLE